MTIEEALQGKEIMVTDDQQVDATCKEYKELSIDVGKILKEQKHCRDEIVAAVTEGALALLNPPAAIQQKPTLHPPLTKHTSCVAAQVSSTTVSASTLLLRQRKLEFFNSTCSIFPNHP